jgi:hypothetical protein
MEEGMSARHAPRTARNAWLAILSSAISILFRVPITQAARAKSRMSGLEPARPAWKRTEACEDDMTPATAERFILRASCMDSIGIAADVAGFLAQRRRFIVETSNFGDPVTGRIFLNGAKTAVLK